MAVQEEDTIFQEGCFNAPLFLLDEILRGARGAGPLAQSFGLNPPSFRRGKREPCRRIW